MHRGLNRDAPQHPQPKKEVALVDFSQPIHTDETGMQFRIRRSDQQVFTYRPSTKELVLLCSVDEWPEVSRRIGLKVRKTSTVKRTSAG